MALEELVKKFYRDELTDYVIYKELARSIKDEKLKEIFKYISDIEFKHAEFWKGVLEKRGIKINGDEIYTLRVRVIKFLSKFLNPILIVSFLELGESSAVEKYYKFLKEDFLTDSEKEELKKIITDELEHENTFEEEADRLGLSNIRDFILGMNDGLVEILGVITGMSAVYVTAPHIVAMSGLIVGVAGALSMGIGAFISVRSQRQVNEALRKKLEILFDVNPTITLEKFKKKLLASGIPERVAEEIAEKFRNREKALKNILVEEVNENEFKSALFTGVAYLVGVIFPIFPYFIFSNSLVALPVSLLSVGLVLSLVATTIAILSGISIKKKIIEMVAAASTATILSFAFGKLMRILFGIEVDV
jgi:VIT1/CCC1 family predicted Fe2+/Mn2+ transporter